MTKEELAALLDGREYGDETTDGLEDLAKNAGLVICYGSSDDLLEFRGAFCEEFGAWGGATVLVGEKRVFEVSRNDDWSDDEMAAYLAAKKSGRRIEAFWCKEEPYSWTYRTNVPHATFDILEDGEKYCRGIVFELPAEGREAQVS